MTTYVFLSTTPQSAAKYTDFIPQVRKFVVRREVQPKKEGAKPYTKAPRIQRLVTPQRLQHKRHLMALKRRRYEAGKEAASEYAELLHKRVGEEKAKNSCLVPGVTYTKENLPK